GGVEKFGVLELFALATEELAFEPVELLGQEQHLLLKFFVPRLQLFFGHDARSYALAGAGWEAITFTNYDFSGSSYQARCMPSLRSMPLRSISRASGLSEMAGRFSESTRGRQNRPRSSRFIKIQRPLPSQ